MDWQTFGAISNIVLVAVLVSVTIYYARQTKKQADSMQEQMTWDRTYRPRLDAYTRFMEAKANRGDAAYRTDMIVPQLDFIQPYSSNEVRTKAKELYKYWDDHRRNNNGKDPDDILERINVQLEPIIISEIEDITKSR